VVAVTLAETEQLLFAASVPLARLIELAPAVAVKVPLQLLVGLAVFATTIPVGNVSVKFMPVMVAVLPVALVIVTVRMEVPPGSVIVVGANPSMTVGAAIKFKVFEAVKPVPPLVELTVPVVLV
jgi:hypothetical protein